MNKKEIINKVAGSWKGSIEGSSVDYVRKLREERMKRLGIISE
jgi:hypothetical protein